MKVDIKRGNVRQLNTYTSGDGKMAYLASFIHHELTREREKELVDLVEKAIIAAVNTFAAS